MSGDAIKNVGDNFFISALFLELAFLCDMVTEILQIRFFNFAMTFRLELSLSLA
jgi:hypothetical protein